jgi:hypothetical protein
MVKGGLSDHGECFAVEEKSRPGHVVSAFDAEGEGALDAIAE